VILSSTKSFNRGML